MTPGPGLNEADYADAKAAGGYWSRPDDIVATARLSVSRVPMNTASTGRYRVSWLPAPYRPPILRWRVFVCLSVQGECSGPVQDSPGSCGSKKARSSAVPSRKVRAASLRQMCIEHRTDSARLSVNRAANSHTRLTKFGAMRPMRHWHFANLGKHFALARAGSDAHFVAIPTFPHARSGRSQLASLSLRGAYVSLLGAALERRIFRCAQSICNMPSLRLTLTQFDCSAVAALALARDIDDRSVVERGQFQGEGDRSPPIWLSAETSYWQAPATQD